MYSRGFLYDRPMLGHRVFEGLPVDYEIGQAAPAPTVVTTPAPVVVTTPNLASTIGTVAIVGAVGFLALELTGVTKFTGIRKYMK
jgi:hypothetical protein